MENIVDKYNQAERAGRATVSNRAIEAFSLELWNTLGYPFKVETESELWRYHDVMQEGRFKKNLLEVGECSDHELNLIMNTAKQILSFSERHLPIRNSGKHALTKALYQYKLTMRNRPHNNSLRILEIGPGSGYLGLLLANDGHQYFAMDAAQAFYLYQKKLWSDIYGSDYFDYSESTSRPDNAKVTHIPWWRFANLSIPIPDVDIMTCNHALAEMHPEAVKTIFRRLYSAWGDTDAKLVLAETLGWQKLHRKQTIFQDIRNLGFYKIKATKDVHVWKPNIALSEEQEKEAKRRPRLTSKIKRRYLKLLEISLRNLVLQHLAKLINRGPLHQANKDQLEEVMVHPLIDFFELLVPDERTPDEIFDKPRIGEIK